jgi:hypothetical protein
LQDGVRSPKKSEASAPSKATQSETVGSASADANRADTISLMHEIAIPLELIHIHILLFWKFYTRNEDFKYGII